MTRLIEKIESEIFSIVKDMGSKALESVQLALKECLKNENYYATIREISENLAKMEDDVENKIVELILRYQPVATDLRKVKSALRISYDFLRLGRYALDISVANRKIGSITKCNSWIISSIEEMGKIVLEMINLSIDAINEFNENFIEEMKNRERKIDEMYFSFIDRLLSAGKNDDVHCVVSSVLVARYLERIADHTIYLSREIIYANTGKKVIIK